MTDLSSFPMSRVILVGELNPYGADPYFALYHLPREASGNRLREILGLGDVDYLKLGRVNLCTGSYSPNVAAAQARLLLSGPYDFYVLLGAKVRAAFGGPAFFSHERREDGRILVGLPHPSGRCRVWSDVTARPRARALLLKLCPQVPWGEVDSKLSGKLALTPDAVVE